MRDELSAAVWVALLGGLGSVMRYSLSVWCKWAGYSFPVGTLAVNVIGCFLLGCLIGSIPHRGGWWLAVYPGITAGLLGGLTTFSALSVETLQLCTARGWMWGTLNVALNLILGLLAAWLGSLLSR
jgi:CrcB protein